MENLIDFINQNYGWFLGIGLVLVFGLIGFIADSKKNKGEPKIKNEKIKKEDSPVEQPIAEQPVVIQPIIESNESNNQESNTYESPVVDVPAEDYVESIANQQQLDNDGVTPEENPVESEPEKVEYAYNNYSELPVEEPAGVELYNDDDFDELKNYANTEVVENPIDEDNNVSATEDNEEISPVIDESVVAKQPNDTDAEPVETESDLDDIWKI